MTSVTQIDSLTPRHQEWLNCVAFTFYDNNQPDKAMALWQAILSVNPDDLYAAVALCQVYLQKKSYDEAVNLCLQLVEVEAIPIKIYLVLSQAYLGLEQYNEARVWANKYMESNQ